MKHRTGLGPLSQLLAAAGLCLAAAGCGSTRTSETDAAPNFDASPIEIPARPGLFQTAGGGKVSSANFRAEIRMGAPQPMGTTTSANFNARLGPSTE